jgi:hypothetical protein
MVTISFSSLRTRLNHSSRLLQSYVELSEMEAELACTSYEARKAFSLRSLSLARHPGSLLLGESEAKASVNSIRRGQVSAVSGRRTTFQLAKNNFRRVLPANGNRTALVQ